MKKIYIFIITILIFLWTNSVHANFQNQWFTKFEENAEWIIFECNSQCFVILWELRNNDYIKINWNLNWSWSIGYWFPNWKQLVPWNWIAINWSNILNKEFSIKELSFYSQLPKDIQVILFIQGNIKWSSAKIELWELWLLESIWKWWDDFWINETLTPYSINLRYWVKILWTSIIKISYILFIIIILIWIWFVNKKDRTNFVIYVFLWFFLLIWIRNLISYWEIFNKWRQDYILQQQDNKIFFDLWDYLTFTKKIRETLKLDSFKGKCTIYIDSFQEWPFKTHWKSIYLKPCDIVEDRKKADYSIYYKKNPSNSWSIILDFNWSFLYKNN